MLDKTRASLKHPPLEMSQNAFSCDIIAEAGPAAFLQTQIWLQDQRAPKVGVYNIPTALRVRGQLNQDALRKALDCIVHRHESLRTSYRGGEAELQQLICEPGPVEFNFHSLTGLPADEKNSTLQERLRTYARRPFDLEREQMIRADLFQLDQCEHVLLITTHHIASDGWSVGVLLEELKQLYSAYAAKQQLSLPELPIQYADYAAWQREQSADIETQLSYWKDELRGEIPPLDLPLDHQQTAEESFAGERERLALFPELSARIHSTAVRFKVTPFTLLYAAFKVLLARYCNQTDVITGSVVSGRTRTELENLIGFFVNMLVIRAPLPDEITTAELLKRLQVKLLNAFAHQDAPYDRVVAALGRTPSMPPLVQAVFTVQAAFPQQSEWGPLKVEWVDMNTGTAKFDLNLTIEQHQQEFVAVVEYRSDLFDRPTMVRFLQYYQRLLGAMISEPDAPVWKLPILSSQEQTQILEEWNATESVYSRDKSIHDLFLEQVSGRPEAIALEFNDETVTYRSLNERADALAGYLRQIGSGPGCSIGICMERGIDLVVALLGILKSGGCYVPLEPEYPAERLRFLASDSGAPILLTHLKHISKLKGSNAQVIALDEPAVLSRFRQKVNVTQVQVPAESPAYVMYTSGSTGTPKGVVIPHRAVVRLVKGSTFAVFGPDEIYLQYAPISFDASTFEIWAPLLNGGKLCIMPPGASSLEDLEEVIRNRKITTLWLTSALFNLMVEERIGCLKGLRQLLTGGDAASYSHFCKFQSEVPSCRLINGYGPTENTTFTTCLTAHPEDLREGIVPIGKPISNTQVYILDRFLQPVPVNVAGELYTSGDGLALEYLNAPELTAQKFLPHPFKKGQRIYRTGDQARFLPNGNIRFLGRLDQQVKIRGYRIEIGEIECALRAHPAIRDAVVIALAEDRREKRLVAFWIAEDRFENFPSDALRHFLKENLPEFLVPTEFVCIKEFPLSANGKVDRKSLAQKYEKKEPDANVSEVPNQLEEMLLAIWRDVLKTETIGIHDDFFVVGGHSLMATQVISRINKQLKIRLPLRVIFDHSTVSELALVTRDLQPE